MKRIALALIVLVSVACRPVAERRPVSLREEPAPEQGLEGKVSFVRETRVGETRIFVTDLASGTLRRFPTPRGSAGSPSWSPDGRHIAYSVASERWSHIWVSNADGSDPRPLTTGAVIDDYPAWAPDGREIVFASIRREHSNWRLYRMRFDGSRVRPLGPETGQNVFPGWAPSGKSIVFASRRGSGGYDLWLLDMDSRDVRQITQGSGDDLFPSFSPDGSGILFASDRTRYGWQVFVVDPGTLQVQPLIRTDSSDRYPAYSPDGRFVVASSAHLVVYRADGEALPDDAFRWRLTDRLAWAASWTG